MPLIKPWPLRALPTARPADWGARVTVCLSLICEKSRSIICVSDEKIDMGDFAADHIGKKSAAFDWDCGVLYAGNDPEYATKIIDEARSEYQKSGHSRNPRAAASFIHKSYLNLLKEQIESRVLSRYGFTSDSFKLTGKKLLPPEEYASIFSDMNKIKLSLHFLICGFEKRNRDYEPYILSVTGNSLPADHTNMGMWAIGAGQSQALSSLSFAADKRKLGKRSSLGVGLYSALEAKFMAESNSLVGSSTWFWILSPNRVRGMEDSAIEKIKSKWLRQGAPRVPPGVVDDIPASLWTARVVGSKKNKRLV